MWCPSLIFNHVYYLCHGKSSRKLMIMDTCWLICFLITWLTLPSKVESGEYVLGEMIVPRLDIQESNVNKGGTPYDKNIYCVWPQDFSVGNRKENSQRTWVTGNNENLEGWFLRLDDRRWTPLKTCATWWGKWGGDSLWDERQTETNGKEKASSGLGG